MKLQTRGLQKGRSIMFDTIKVGRKIAELRKKQNMTQFELADKLGISFQAVSNWERGNSMPDISKLPELAELFEVSIDEVLGKSNPVLNEVVKDEKAKLINYSETDINEAADLIKPQKIKEMIECSEYNPIVISALLPFLDSECIEELMNKCKNAGECIALFLPFLSCEKIDELAEETNAKGESFEMFLPFMSQEKIKELAYEAFYKSGIKGASPYLPFMEKDDLKRLAEKL